MLIITGKMLHQYFFLVILWVYHACGTHYYYDGGFEDEKNNQASYAFKYGVRDHDTGDIKNQWEVRKGDRVKGEYSLVEPDGTIRTVQYSADKKNGFNAIVTREGKSQHPLTKYQSFKPYLLAGLGNEFGSELINHLSEYPKEEPEITAKYPFRRPISRPTYYSQEGYKVSESERKSFNTLPEVPPNHSPIYTGVSDYNKLVTMYKNFREQNSETRKNKFDYGITEYFENGYAALNQRFNHRNLK